MTPGAAEPARMLGEIWTQEPRGFLRLDHIVLFTGCSMLGAAAGAVVYEASALAVVLCALLVPLGYSALLGVGVVLVSLVAQVQRRRGAPAGAGRGRASVRQAWIPPQRTA